MAYRRWKAQADQTVRKFKATAIEQFGGGTPPDPDTLISTAGGNWNVDHLQVGDEANVQAGVPFGLNQEGTGIVQRKLIILKTPTP